MSSASLRFVFIGSGPQLIACAERCLLRGHRLVGVISDCPQASTWAQRRGITRISASADILAFVQAEPYDYLASVVHHAIVPPAVLATAEVGAINYHDSLLPAYAGFNATSWALLDGQARHGITWHQMTADVDSGSVLAQPSFEIAEDDTAFTLSVKCSEAGVAAFAQLLDQLEQRSLAGTPQGEGRSFNLRSKRPDVALLQLDRGARELSRFVRALNLGPDENWMAKPKLWLGSAAIAFTEARVQEGHAAPAGTVLSIDRDGLTVATGEGALAISDLRTLAGEPLDSAALRSRFGVHEGLVVGALDATACEQASAFDQRVTKHERFWLKRLRSLHAPQLAGLSAPTTPLHERAATPSVVTRVLPAQAATLQDDERRAVLVAALAALIVRSAERGAFDLGLARALPGSLQPFYASVTPLSFFRSRAEEPGTSTPGDVDRTFAALLDATRLELAEHEQRQTYARDIVLRYPALRERAPADLVLPIAVRFDGAAQLAEGASLTLVLGPDATRYTWVSAEGALSNAAAARLFERFEVLLAHALSAPATELRRLPLLPKAERELLIDKWQDTHVPYAHDRCVHQLIEAQVDRTPDSIAVRFRGRSLTYRELDQRANRVAHALRARGVGPDVLVGLCIERSLEMVVGLLAVHKAGGAYVPLDPVYPRDRLAMMLEDAKAPVLLTQHSLLGTLPESAAEALAIETLLDDSALSTERPRSDVAPSHLAYVIFTSGSTGRPKGVMVQHGNAANFFTGMDRALGHEQPGRWLAVTSISFDISVLELFWTLSRGFEVVVQEELDRASLARPVRSERKVSSARMGFGLFYFAAETGSENAPGNGGAYRLLLEGARFADEHDFDAVWTPERHFHQFGGLYPNPAVTTAALATMTKRISLRAGSIVLPLHNPLRVAEDWAVIDHLSNGRIGLSFASGWHVNDFAFMPDNYERRREVMLESIETVRKLWRGEKVAAKNGNGETIEVSVLPRPLNPNPPVWVASAGNVETFQLAGRMGFHVLTNMLGQDLNDLRNKLRAYREARREHGHEGDGIVSVMLHTFVCEDTERARELARRPFSNYLASSFDLVKVAPWMFPAFKQPSKGSSDAGFDPSNFTGEDMQALLDHAFDRYFDTAGLFGSPEKALDMVEQLKSIGANEVACLVDFGVPTDEALRGLTYLDKLRQLSNPVASSSVQVVRDEPEELGDFGVGTQLQNRQITHLQCTPSMARMLLSDPDARAALRGLKKLLLGGEALPRELADELLTLVGGEIINMYGPTETTVWSSTSRITNHPITIGRPIANTVIRLLDPHGELTPVGVPGELCIGGAGVVRGYLGRPDLTAERFIQDPCDPAQRIYRTGDLARYREDGELEFLGRLDHQVKVNGYRIELGEIETALVRHPSVRQSVVVARSDGGPTQLVAYLVANGASDDQAPDARVEQWASLWDETYKLATAEGDAAAVDPRFNIAGWRDSFTGAQHPAVEMREWLDATVARVLARRPRRVLEIGCGTGMILFGVLPHVEHYTAVDVAAHALETIRKELTPGELSKVSLVQQPAHALEGLVDASYDIVVINSVAQYFPSHGYLTDVLRRASELVADGGHIFVGDIRNLTHLQAFHTRAELTQAPDGRSAEELATRIERRLKNEGEILLSESYFDGLVGQLPRIAAVDVQLKRGLAYNEMSCFRYDVTLYVGRAPVALPIDASKAECLETLPAIAARLRDEPPLLYVRDVPNARLSGVYEAVAKLQAGQGPASTLRETMQSVAHGVSPEALYQLSPAYDVTVVQARSGDPARFDVAFRQRTSGPEGRLALSPLRESQVANEPARATDASSLQNELREHLRATLPEYMVPALFVQLPAFPLTPNGKIDRKALPAPGRSTPRADVELALPSSDLEQQIAGVWQSVLSLERVGRSENIFDLGANSLLTVQAANKLSTVLGRKVSLVSMFRFPTVAALAAQLGVEAGGPASQLAASVVGKRTEERGDRRKDAAERRRQLRAGRSAQGVGDE